MITNERQYRISNAQLRKFDEALAAQAKRDPSPGVDPRIHAAMGDAIESQADELRDQIREYEDLREGRIKRRKLDSLRDIPTTLIEVRIASHTTQKGLGNKLGVAEQQVQRWESTGYAGVGFERLQEVADVLDVKLGKTVTFPKPKKQVTVGKVGKVGGPKRATSRASASARSAPAGKRASSAQSRRARARRAS
jgi:HTH-type transcriptional regulator/antitoxin HigA